MVLGSEKKKCLYSIRISNSNLDSVEIFQELQRALDLTCKGCQLISQPANMSPHAQRGTSHIDLFDLHVYCHLFPHTGVSVGECPSYQFAADVTHFLCLSCLWTYQEYARSIVVMYLRHHGPFLSPFNHISVNQFICVD